MKTQLLLLASVFGMASVCAADQPAAPPPASLQMNSGLSLRTKEVKRLGVRLVIEGRGPKGAELLAELGKGAAYRNLALYLDGVEIPGLRASYEVPDVDRIEMELNNAKAEHEASKAKNPPNGDKGSIEKLEAAEKRKRDMPVVSVAFLMDRDSEKDANRLAWDAFFKAREAYDSPVQVSISIDRGKPVLLGEELMFVVADGWRYWISLLVGMGLFLALLTGVGHYSDMLRDNGQPNGCYSLGRTQMAFWGSLVFGTWVGIALLCGCMEHIPAQTLVLLGISGTTGLGAIMVGSANTGVTQNIPSRGFLQDLVTGDQGVSFQRVQVVVWTLALGGFFIWNVSQTMSMPIFSDTLLVLMGISNGTYLGFKMQEGKLSVDAWKIEGNELAVNVSGGTSPYQWKLVSDPANALTVAPGSLQLPGDLKIPLSSTVAPAKLTLTVTDKTGTAIALTHDMDLSVAPLAVAGTAVTTTIVGGTPDYTWALTSNDPGTFPPQHSPAPLTKPGPVNITLPAAPKVGLELTLTVTDKNNQIVAVKKV